jgi:hypothetical protein
LEIIEQQRSSSGTFVFSRPDGRPVTPGMTDRGPLKGTGFTLHGFRSSFRDWAGEQTSFAHDVCEAALAHSRGAVHAAYQRGDLLAKRRKLMDAWAAYCSTPPPAGAVVTPLRKAGANA